MSCKCQACTQQYSIDFLVPDDIWEQIKPEGSPHGDGLLCPSCIGKRVEDLCGGEYGGFHLTAEPFSWERFYAKFFPDVDPKIIEHVTKYFPIVSDVDPDIDAKIDAYFASKKKPAKKICTQIEVYGCAGDHGQTLSDLKEVVEDAIKPSAFCARSLATCRVKEVAGCTQYLIRLQSVAIKSSSQLKSSDKEGT